MNKDQRYGNIKVKEQKKNLFFSLVISWGIIVYTSWKQSIYVNSFELEVMQQNYPHGV